LRFEFRLSSSTISYVHTVDILIVVELRLDSHIFVDCMNVEIADYILSKFVAFTLFDRLIYQIRRCYSIVMREHMPFWLDPFDVGFQVRGSRWCG
jgi:hypothetical protein